MTRLTLATGAAAVLLTVMSAFSITAFAKQVHDETPVELSGFSISQSYEIEDDQPLDLSSPMLKQLLYRIQRTSPESRNKYAGYSQEIAWNDIKSNTADYRFWVFDRTARLKRIEKRTLKNQSPDEDINSVFVCHCESIPLDRDNESSGESFIALARTMPSALRVDVDLDEPVHMSGFLYARILGNQANKQVAFITDRLAWFPEKETPSISPAQIQLAAHGVDMGLIDSVRENNTRPLGSDDAEAFFQFIGAVHQLEDGLPDANQARLGFTDLMQQASKNFGEAVRISGTVRTCSVIPVTHTDIQNRLGITQYYQLMLFPDLDGAKIVVNSKDGKQLDYRRFPVTVCVSELPAGMSPQDVERKQFEIDGFFFRFWKYQSEKTDTAQTTGQVSPLIIAKRPTLIEPVRNQLNSILFGFIAFLICGVGALVVYFWYVDRGKKTPAVQMIESLPDQIDLTGIQDSL